MTHETITCEALDERLADYLDGTLDAGEGAAVEAHAESCVRCRALLADLRALTRDAAALPELRPSRDLWDGVAARIDAPVVPLGAPHARRVGWAAPRQLPAAWLAVAAAALVILTAGVTYRWTMRHALSDAVALRSDTSRSDTGRAPGAAARLATPVAAAAAPPDVGPLDSAARTPQAQLAVRSPSRGGSGAGNAGALPPAFQMYGREIARLRTVVAQRRGELDPKTVTVIEQNLRLIDKAIRESRAALARDPESGFLHQQLNDALGKKVELLRTVALLPARS